MQRFIDVNTLTGKDKRPELVSDYEAISNSIRNLLHCPIGTRLFLNDYGSSLMSYIHEPIDDETAFKIEISILQEIERWEPRVEVLRSQTSVTPLPAGNGYKVFVAVKIRTTGQTAAVDFNVLRPLLSRTI